MNVTVLGQQVVSHSPDTTLKKTQQMKKVEKWFTWERDNKAACLPTYVNSGNSDKKWGFPSSHLFRTWLSFVEKTDTTSSFRWPILSYTQYSMTWCHSYEALVFILGRLAQPRALGGLLSAAILSNANTSSRPHHTTNSLQPTMAGIVRAFGLRAKTEQ